MSTTFWIGSLSLFPSQDMADHLQKKKSKRMETGSIRAWEVKKNYVYLSADMTAAYDPKIVKRATRELVWLGNKALIILDRVQANAPAKWILHGNNEPQVGRSSFVFTENGSKLVGHTLLPAKAKIRSVGSYDVDGISYPLPDKATYHVAGGHRIEVSGGATFLHVLIPADAGQSVPRPKLIKRGGIGVELMGRKVTFTRSGVKVK